MPQPQLPDASDANSIGSTVWCSSSARPIQSAAKARHQLKSAWNCWFSRINCRAPLRLLRRSNMPLKKDRLGRITEAAWFRIPTRDSRSRRQQDRRLTHLRVMWCNRASLSVGRRTFWLTVSMMMPKTRFMKMGRPTSPSPTGHPAVGTPILRCPGCSGTSATPPGRE